MKIQTRVGHDSINWLANFLQVTSIAAAMNFADIVTDTIRTRAPARGADGFEITVCYFGPPTAYYPRLLVMLAVLLAAFSILKITARRSAVAVLALSSAFLTYLFWWLTSYRMFRNLADWNINFINNNEIKHVAYLRDGTWLDIAVVIAIVVCLVLTIEKLLQTVLAPSCRPT